MRNTIAGLGLAALSLIGLGSILTSTTRAQDRGGDDHAGRLFERRCAGCHTVPDTRFATDKAWLGQVLETA